MGNFTQDALDFYLDYVDNEARISNERLLALHESRDAEYWKEVLLGIAKEFTLSSRFALMRFVYSITTGAGLGEGDSETEFVVEGCKGEYRFKDLSIEHAQNLPTKELNQYRSVLQEHALSFSADKDLNADLIGKALRIQRNRRTSLSRSEAMKLGHILGFNVQQMQWFLLRVFENGGGFALNSSEDLIDIYGFYCEHDVQHVEKLKEKYAQTVSCINKKDVVDIREENWTLSLEETLGDKINAWKENNQDSDESFLNWMLEISPWLDYPSRTTLWVYRDLLAFAYRILNENIRIPDADELYDTLRDVIVRGEGRTNTITTLFDKKNPAQIDEAKSRNVITAILRDNNKSYSGVADACKAYRTISANYGRLSLKHARTFHYEPDENGKKKYTHHTIRIADLISGEKTTIEKADILYLLWYIWNKVYFSRVDLDASNRYNGVCAFIDCANMILKASGLEGFYLPHIMEQSMLISILETDWMTPGFIYDELCEAVILRA